MILPAIRRVASADFFNGLFAQAAPRFAIREALLFSKEVVIHGESNADRHNDQ